MAILFGGVYTGRANGWLTKILDVTRDMDPQEKKRLDGYLLSRIRDSDREFQSGRQKSSDRILGEYLSLTDALKARDNYRRRLFRIVNPEIILTRMLQAQTP